MTDALVAAALNASLGNSMKVVTYVVDGENMKWDHELDLMTIHKYQLACGPVSSTLPLDIEKGRAKAEADPEPISIFIKAMAGQTLQLLCNTSDTIGEIKRKICDNSGTPTEQQRIIFGGKQLHDGFTLGYYNVRDQSTLNLVLKLIGGRNIVFHLDVENFLDPRFDYDFTRLKEPGKLPFKRGEFEYKRPCGWRRIALNVLDKYENNAWLGDRGRTKKKDSLEDEWPVSYHGTGYKNCQSIAEHGYLLSKARRARAQFGKGIYSAPNIEDAAEYASAFTHQGSRYKLVFQNRVNPATLIRIEETDWVGECWISPEETDVRPYGLCLLKVKSRRRI